MSSKLGDTGEFKLEKNRNRLLLCNKLELGSLVAQRFKRLPAMQKSWVRSLGREDPLEKEMATHSSIAWRIPWMEESGRLQSIGSQSWTQLKQLSMRARL